MPGEARCLIGLNAWKQWCAEKNEQVMKRYSPETYNPFKTDILQLSPEQLEFSLSLFVKDVKKTNGERYSGEAVFYMVLGIQQFLKENGASVDIFNDTEFEIFTGHFHEVLVQLESVVLTQETLSYKVDEAFLWASTQFGASSPQALLNTVLYINTKYFKLKKPEDHFRFCFNHLHKLFRVYSVGHPGIFTCPHAPITIANTTDFHNPAVSQSVPNLNCRCPIRILELYISKCPRNITGTLRRFYLVPLANPSPYGQWFSFSPLRKKCIEKMLQRMKLVEEISDIFR